MKLSRHISLTLHWIANIGMRWIDDSYSSYQPYENLVDYHTFDMEFLMLIMGSPQATTPNTLEASTPETLKRVVEIVANQLATSIDSVNPHSKFQDLGADSLDQVVFNMLSKILH